MMLPDFTPPVSTPPRDSLADLELRRLSALLVIAQCPDPTSRVLHAAAILRDEVDQ